MRRVLLLATSAIAAGVLCAAPAFGYDETGSGRTCVQCHGSETVDPAAEGTGRQGPHGGYATTTRKCQTCHNVHVALASRSLLPRATVKATCEVCHDGSGGAGVYGTVRARTGSDPLSGHRIDVTGVIPGGDGSTGGDRTIEFLGEDENLTCVDCHSPHGASTVAPFTGDRRREAGADPDGTGTVGFTSSRLLKKRPTGAVTPVEEYGSDWCAACHRGRMDDLPGAVFNHPVETTSTPGCFTYQELQVVTGAGASTTATGTLGRSNRGYVMPYPYTAGQSGHAPICQQCHEDSRSVGDIQQNKLDATEEFSPDTIDGQAPGNPRFHTFPHESDERGLLVEIPDDLCFNCHDPVQQLP